MTFDISLSASVPTRSQHNDARQGMPDLAGTFEIGPNLNVELWQSADRRLKVEFRMPLRQAITLESHRRRRPHVLAEHQPRHPRLHRRLEARPADRAAVRQPAPAPVLLRRGPGVRDAVAAGLRRSGRLFRLAGDRRALAPLRQRSTSAASSATTTSTARASRPAPWCAATARSPPASACHGSSRHRISASWRTIDEPPTGPRIARPAPPAAVRARHRPARSGVARLGPGRAAAVAGCCRGGRARRVGRARSPGSTARGWATAERLGMMRGRLERARCRCATSPAG